MYGIYIWESVCKIKVCFYLMLNVYVYENSDKQKKQNKFIEILRKNY